LARWLRDFHGAVADLVPSPGAVWRGGARWSPGLIIGHNDAAPYNARGNGTLVGFFDWDFASPVMPEWDLAFTAFSWVPLHARHVVAAEGIRQLAAEGDPLFDRLLQQGVAANLDRAVVELGEFPIG
jgi:thiamine kinase-like enzyme